MFPWNWFTTWLVATVLCASGIVVSPDPLNQTTLAPTPHTVEDELLSWIQIHWGTIAWFSGIVWGFRFAVIKWFTVEYHQFCYCIGYHRGIDKLALEAFRREIDWKDWHTVMTGLHIDKEEDIAALGKTKVDTFFDSSELPPSTRIKFNEWHSPRYVPPEPVLYRSQCSILPTPPCRSLATALSDTDKPIVNELLSEELKLHTQLLMMKQDLVAGKEDIVSNCKLADVQLEASSNSESVQYHQGMLILDTQFEKQDPRRSPFGKVVSDICLLHSLPLDIQKTMLNEAVFVNKFLVHFEFKFTNERLGQLVFGKYMAVNINGRVDVILLVCKLQCHPPSAASNDATEFVDFCRLKMFQELGPHITGLR